ncbi:kelch-like protein 28 [Arctopsyche grandis]|uniref:kelch-like protein 28 n=1 Tax=Arctopsyche grandis TaxID=121162 RepID=UPI00406D6486
MNVVNDEIDIQHALHVLGQMYNFYKENVLCNVDLVVGKNRFPVHRLIMISNSDYLKERLVDTSNEIVLENSDDFLPNTVKRALQYFYTGRLDLDPRQAVDLIKFSKTIQSQKLEDYCLSYLEGALNTKNFLLIGEFAEHCGYSQLLEKTKTYTIDNFVDLIQGKAFLNMNNEQLEELLQSHDLNVTTEEQVFQGLKLWVQNDWDNRKKHLDILFKFIRFPLLPLKFIFDEVKPLCYDSVCCYQLLWDLFEWHNNPEKRPHIPFLNLNPRRSSQTILIIGGHSPQVASEIQICNGLLGKKWSTLYNIKKNLYNFAAALLDNNKLIILGGVKDHNQPQQSTSQATPVLFSNSGLFAKQTAFSQNNQPTHTFATPSFTFGSKLSNVEPQLTNEVCSLDLATKDLTELKPMQQQKYLFATAVMNDQVFVIGGLSEIYKNYKFGSFQNFVSPQGHGANKPLRSVERYNIVMNSWTSVASMLAERYHHEAVVLDGNIYVIGGSDGNTVLNTMEIYITKRNEWKLAPPMTVQRSEFAAVALGGYIYAIGGINGIPLVSVERLDIKENTWSSVASLPEARFGHRAVVCDEKIICVGGNLNSSVLEYDPNTDTWIRNGSLSQPLRNFNMMVVPMLLLNKD